MASNHHSFLSDVRDIENNRSYKFLLTEKRQSIQRLLNLYRGQIIDSVEMHAGQSVFWPNLRSRLLNLLGDRGLQSAVLNELERSFADSLPQERDAGGVQ